MTTARTGGTDAVLPGTPREWIIATGRVSGLMLVLLGSETVGDELPEPLGRSSARAWGRVTRALRDAPDDPVIEHGDLDVLGSAARTLGRELCRYRMSGHESAAVAALLAEARIHGTPPEQLVAQVARVHGVLDAGPGTAADGLWTAAG